MQDYSVSSVPIYLRNGKFYESLEVGDDGVIRVPSDCMKDEGPILSPYELRSLLRSLDFWLILELPLFLFEYAFNNPFESYEHVISEFYYQFPSLLCIEKVANARMEHKIMAAAVNGAPYELIFYLRQVQGGHQWPSKVCDIYAASGNLKLLTYAHTTGAHFTGLTCTKAASSGSLECLKYLHDNNCVWDWNTTTAAALNGHLNCLKYLHENGCAWQAADYVRSAEDDNACHSATRNGHLDCLQYAHQNGCPLSPGTCSRAALNNHFDCLRYAHTHGADIAPTTCDAMLKNQHKVGVVSVPCFQYAHLHGPCPLRMDFARKAAVAGNLELLKYLHEQGCRFSATAAEAAANHNHPQCLEYLLSRNRACRRSKLIATVAFEKGNAQCLSIANKYGCFV